MRIGIIAAYNNNYGSLLQCYAMQKVITNLGHKSEIIIYRKRNLMTQILRCFNLSLLKMKLDDVYKNVYTKFFYKNIYSNIQIRNIKFTKFRDERLSFSSEAHSKKQLYSMIKSKYDMVLLGSDQVWNPINIGTHFFTMELVPQDTYKVTYAPSFGVKKIPWYQKNRTKRYLQRIECISVREKSGADIIKRLINRDVPVVCDPTILIEKKEWDIINESDKLIKEPYLFCYFLGDNPDHRLLATQYAKKHKLKIVTLQHLDKFIKSDLKFADEQLYNVGPKEFVNLINNANFIFTDSFHGTVFSILYNKFFYAFPRYSAKSASSTNDRIDDLLGRLGLETRKLKGNENADQLVAPNLTKINFDKGMEEIQKFRKISMKYLIDAIGGVNCDK